MRFNWQTGRRMARLGKKFSRTQRGRFTASDCATRTEASWGNAMRYVSEEGHSLVDPAEAALVAMAGT
jgi:hypothetical protein